MKEADEGPAAFAQNLQHLTKMQSEEELTALFELSVGGGAQGAAKQAAGVSKQLNGRALEDIQTDATGTLQLRAAGDRSYEEVADINDDEVKTILSTGILGVG